MTSRQKDIGEFIESVKGRPFDEVIYMTDQEATDIERYLYKECRQRNCEELREYATYLKDLILYLRYGVITRSIRALDLSDLKLSFSN